MYICVHVCTHIQLAVDVCPQLVAYLCVYVRKHARVYVCTYLCMYLFMCHGWMDGWMDGSPSWLCSDTGVFGRIIVFSILTTVTIIVTARTRTAIIAVLAASPSCMAVTLLVL